MDWNLAKNAYNFTGINTSNHLVDAVMGITNHNRNEILGSLVWGTNHLNLEGITFKIRCDLSASNKREIKVDIIKDDTKFGIDPLKTARICFHQLIQPLHDKLVDKTMVRPPQTGGPAHPFLSAQKRGRGSGPQRDFNTAVTNGEMTKSFVDTCNKLSIHYF